MGHDWQQLTPIERLFVECSDPSDQMNITIIFALSENVSRAWLDAPLTRLLSHPRFRSRLVFPPRGAPYFTPVPGFAVGSSSIEPHLHVQPPIDPRLPFARRHAQFMDRVSDIASDFIRLDAPLWRLFLFPDFSPVRMDAGVNGDLGSTLVVKVHHAVADGLGLLKFFLSRVLDPVEAPTPGVSPRSGNPLAPSAMPHRQRPAGDTHNPDTERGARIRPVSSTPPKSVLTRALGYLWDALSTPIRLLIPDPPSPLTTPPPTRHKLCAMLPPHRLPLPTLRATARALGVTINDLLYAAISATFARLLADRAGTSASTSDVGARIVIPFNEHALTGFDDGELHNRFAFLFQPLHLSPGVITPPGSATEQDRVALDRLQRCAASMHDAKSGIRPAVSLLLTRVLARLPLPLKRVVWRRLTEACGQAFSNVPGPRGRVRVAGVECESAHFFVPQEGQLRVGVALLSYDGGVGVTVQGDRARLPDPAGFLDALFEEIMRFVAIAKGVVVDRDS